MKRREFIKTAAVGAALTAAPRPATAAAATEDPVAAGGDHLRTPRLLQLAEIGNPALRMKAAPVKELKDPRVQALIDDMIATMQDAGGVGIAAPQVVRPSAIKVKFTDRAGAPREELYKDFVARIVQHELDHLDGRLYLDRLPDMLGVCSLKEYSKRRAEKK